MVSAAACLLLASIPRAAFASSPTTRAEAPTPLLGKWIVDARGEPIGPESFRRGLQTSGLVWRHGELWSIGDQRGAYPGHLLRIDPATGRLVGAPLPIVPPAKTDDESPAFAVYRALPNADFEGLAAHPRRASVLFAVTEDKTPWFAELHLETRPDGDGDGAASTTVHLVTLTELRFPAGLAPWRESPNFRLEGLAISADARTAWFAWERASDDLPRILSAPLERLRAGGSVELIDLGVDFSSVPARADKGPAQLNLNDIQFSDATGRPSLLAVARDQERLLSIDLETRRVTTVLDLDLRDPDGHSIHWVSPEGLAYDEATDRLWIVNDPDSVRGNFRRLDEEQATGPYALYAPLLFELPLSRLTSSTPSPRAVPATGADRP